MAVKQFAIPLDSGSKQTGEITIQALKNAGTSATFQLTNVVAGLLDELNLITQKSGSPTSHKFTLSIVNGVASATVGSDDLSKIFNDAAGGDWDYVEAHWTAGQVDNPSSSVCYVLQGGGTYNLYGWPPKKR